MTIEIDLQPLEGHQRKAILCDIMFASNANRIQATMVEKIKVAGTEFTKPAINVYLSKVALPENQPAETADGVVIHDEDIAIVITQIETAIANLIQSKF
jgi:hypothetical protein